MKNERECRLLKGVSLLENRYAASLLGKAEREGEKAERGGD